MILIEKMMVGDWVMFTDPDDGTTEPHKVEEEDFGQGERYYKCFEPIPITEDMMNKNFPEYEPGYEIGWWPNDDGTFIVGYKDNMSEINMNMVRYVHEIQHMMHLVGFRREIVI